MELVNSLYRCCHYFLRQRFLLAGALPFHQFVTNASLVHGPSERFVGFIDFRDYLSTHSNVGIDVSGLVFLVDGHRHSMPYCLRAICTDSIGYRREGRGGLIITSPCCRCSRAAAGLIGCSVARAGIIKLRMTPSFVASNGCCCTLFCRWKILIRPSTTRSLP